MVWLTTAAKGPRHHAKATQLGFVAMPPASTRQRVMPLPLHAAMDVAARQGQPRPTAQVPPQLVRCLQATPRHTASTGLPLTLRWVWKMKKQLRKRVEVRLQAACAPRQPCKLLNDVVVVRVECVWCVSQLCKHRWRSESPMTTMASLAWAHRHPTTSASHLMLHTETHP